MKKYLYVLLRFVLILCSFNINAQVTLESENSIEITPELESKIIAIVQDNFKTNDERIKIVASIPNYNKPVRESVISRYERIIAEQNQLIASLEKKIIVLEKLLSESKNEQ